MATRPLSALLDRFRRGVAVPAAVGDDLAMELAPVFASLEEFEREAKAVESASTAEAESRLEDAREHAARISATWREEAEAERTRAAEARRRRSRAEARALEVEGRAEADRIRRQAAERMPELVASILGCIERGAAEVHPRAPQAEEHGGGSARREPGADSGVRRGRGDPDARREPGVRGGRREHDLDPGASDEHDPGDTVAGKEQET
jgi:vacuolar-type H+-ATPase subunit H